jgi:hypothetical protein
MVLRSFLLIFQSRIQKPRERNAHELLIFIDALDEATDMHGLRICLDDYIHESFGYFHNLLVLRYYLPEVSKVPSEVLTFSSEMTRRFDNYLKLLHFFESTKKKSTIERALKEAEDAVARTRQNLTFRPKKKEKLSGLPKKFHTLKSAFDRLETFLWRSIYEGPMPPIYAFKHRTDQEQERAFPLAVPLNRSADYLQALQNQRANMQAKSKRALEQFERGVESGTFDVRPLDPVEEDRALAKAKRKAGRTAASVLVIEDARRFRPLLLFTGFPRSFPELFSQRAELLVEHFETDHDQLAGRGGAFRFAHWVALVLLL